MMKISKLVILALMLVCTIGIVSAADLPELKVPDKFTNLDGESYTNQAEGIELEVFGENLTEFFTNDTELKFTITPGKINNTFNYTDGTNNMIGISELVTINDKHYVVEVWKESNATDISLDKLYDTLEEVNKLNSLTPEDPSTL